MLVNSRNGRVIPKFCVYFKRFNNSVITIRYKLVTETWKQRRGDREVETETWNQRSGDRDVKTKI